MKENRILPLGGKITFRSAPRNTRLRRNHWNQEFILISLELIILKFLHLRYEGVELNIGANSARSFYIL